MAKNRVEGGNNPGAFVINTCELSAHILISNKDECDNMDLKSVEKALKKSCDKKLDEFKSNAVGLPKCLSNSRH